MLRIGKITFVVLSLLLLAAVPSFAWEDEREVPTGASSAGAMTGVDALFEQLAVVKQAVSDAVVSTVEKGGGPVDGPSVPSSAESRRGGGAEAGSSAPNAALKNISVSDRVGETSGSTTQNVISGGGLASATSGPSGSSSAGTSSASYGGVESPGINAATEAFRRMSARMPGLATQSFGGMISRAQAFNRTPLNPTGADKRESTGGSPNDGRKGTTFGEGRKELTMNNIASNNSVDPTDWRAILAGKGDPNKDAKNKDDAKNKKDKKLTEEEREKLTQTMKDLAAKPPPFNPQDYVDAGNVLMKLGENGGLPPEFIEKAKQIYAFKDPGSGRDLPDTDETPEKDTRLTAYQKLLDKDPGTVFQTPIITGTPAPHRDPVHR